MSFSFFDFILKCHGILGLPAMTGYERHIFKHILLRFPRQEPVHIFEYGSGFSTLYFAHFLKREGIDFHYHSVDNDSFWHQRVKQMVEHQGLADRVHLYLCPFQPFWDKPGWSWDQSPACGKFAPSTQEEHNYIRMPVSLNMKFHLIVVDGRFRKRCLEMIPQALHGQGIVLLHDAQKFQYHPREGQYAYSRWLDSGKFYPWQKFNHKIWLGSFQQIKAVGS